MRNWRRKNREEEEESVFVSMTDMTVGFLFIVMIMMVFFATQFGDPDSVPRKQYEIAIRERNKAISELKKVLEENHRLEAELHSAKEKIANLKKNLEIAIRERDEARRERDNALAELDKALIEKDILEDKLQSAEKEISELKKKIADLKLLLKMLGKHDPLEVYLAKAQRIRRQILERMQDKLKEKYPNLMVEVSPEGDALRFQGEGLFALGSARLRPRARSIIRDLARLTNEAVRCYTLAKIPLMRDGCDTGAILIEAIQIEGHTDRVGSEDANLTLSTNRAIAAFFEMKRARPSLLLHLNLRGQPVLAVAGYGEMRPAVETPDNVNEPANRRIDLRILMYTPSSSIEIEKIRKHLAGEVR